MFFSRIVSTVVLVSFLSAQMPRASAYEENTVYDFGESQIITHEQGGETASCPAPQSSGPADCKNNVSPQVDELAGITDQIAPEEKLPVCSKDDLGGGSLSETEVTELKQNLLNECNARFKKHKRAYAKQLLLHGRPFKALRALLKKKKKMGDIKTTTESKEIKVTGKSLTEVNEEIRVAESNAISELLGGLPEEKSSEMQKEIGNGKKKSRKRKERTGNQRQKV